MAVVALLLGACERPDTLVICHNANCSGDRRLADDSLPALEASLALTGVLDGIDVDLVWDASSEACLFAHDLDDPAATAPVAQLRDALTSYIARSGGFLVKLGLKPHVTNDGMHHTPAQELAHVACALDLAEALEAAGAVEVILSSESPALLAVAAVDPRRAARELSLDFDRAALRELPRELAIDIVQFYAPEFDTTRDAVRRSLGSDLAWWTEELAPDTLAMIRANRPRFIVTNEVELLRRWLDG